MINEVAIDPEVLLEWSKDRGKSKEFLNNYGLGTEPPRYCRRLNILREYDNEKTNLHS